MTREGILKELERVKWFLWHGNVFRADETLTDLMFEVDGAIEEDREARRPAHWILKKLARGRGVRELYRQQRIGYRQLWRAASMRGTYLNRLCGIDNQSAGG